MAKELDKDSYVLARGLMPSTRLNLQHFIFQSELGYHLHPSIPKLGPGTSVIDLGTGTALWMLELARWNPQAKFHGVDIDLSQAPPSAWLPENATLEKLDVFGDMPEHLIGKFDVVNLRFFMLVVKNDDPSTLFNNAIKLLKPGGHIQWSEYDLNTRTFSSTPTTTSPDPATQETHLEALRGAALFWTSSGKHLFPTWASDLGRRAREAGLADVQEQRTRQHPSSQNYLLECVFISFREIGLHMQGETADEFRRRCAQAEEAFLASGRGIGSDIDSVVVVGRKPA